MQLNEILYLLLGLLGGYFLSNYLPAFFDPKQLYSFEAANNFVIIDPTKPVETVTTITKGPKKFKDYKLPIVFKASIFRDPTPDEIIFDEKGVTFNIKTLFRSHQSYVVYNDISGVETKEGILFADIAIKPKIRDDIHIKNFTKSDADVIRSLLQEMIG